jgi:hypothetical protein
MHVEVVDGSVRQKRPLRKPMAAGNPPVLPRAICRQTAQKLKIIVLRYSFLRMVFGRRRAFGSPGDPSFVRNFLSDTRNRPAKTAFAAPFNRDRAHARARLCACFSPSTTKRSRTRTSTITRTIWERASTHGRGSDALQLRQGLWRQHQLVGGQVLAEVSDGRRTGN